MLQILEMESMSETLRYYTIMTRSGNVLRSEMEYLAGCLYLNIF